MFFVLLPLSLTICCCSLHVSETFVNVIENCLTNLVYQHYHVAVMLKKKKEKKRKKKEEEEERVTVLISAGAL